MKKIDTDPKLIIPKSRRRKNMVDVLTDVYRATQKAVEEALEACRKEMISIQSKCKHNFRLLEELALFESQVEGIFIASRSDPPIHPAPFKLQCTKCNTTRTSRIDQTCPKCLGDMMGGELDTDRAKYFRNEDDFFAVRLRHCQSCGFTVASDEWAGEQ